MKTNATCGNTVNTDEYEGSGHIRLYYDEKAGAWQAFGTSARRLERLVPELASEVRNGTFSAGGISLNERQLEKYGLTELVCLVSDSLLVLSAERP